MQCIGGLLLVSSNGKWPMPVPFPWPCPFPYPCWELSCCTVSLLHNSPAEPSCLTPADQVDPLRGYVALTQPCQGQLPQLGKRSVFQFTIIVYNIKRIPFGLGHGPKHSAPWFGARGKSPSLPWGAS